MKYLKGKQALLLTLVSLTVVFASVGSALAYFTDYTYATGGFFLELEHKTTIEEKVLNWKKTVVVANTGECDVYVRANAFSAGAYYPLTFAGTDWTYNSADGFWYYNYVVPVGGRTTALEVSISNIKPGDAEAFSVVVVQECTPVTYINNIAQPADWSLQGKEA